MADVSANKENSTLENRDIYGIKPISIILLTIYEKTKQATA